MISIDDRVGSRELQSYFPKSLTSISRLEYGDFAFIGRGRDGVPYMVGIERKTLNDMVSSLVSGRFCGHQLPGLKNTYNKVYLIVEGIWRPGPKDGKLETRVGRGWRTLGFHPSKSISASALLNFVTSLESLEGVSVRFTSSPRETAFTIIQLYRWWNKEDHNSIHEAFDYGETARIMEPNFERKLMSLLPGVGWKRSGDMYKEFPCLEALMAADVKDLMKVKGIGKGIAVRAWETIHKRKWVKREGK